LQVEHPVTELVTGIDLVREQFHIAQGGKLRFQQSDIQLRGAAIECRIYAEDANKNFMPHPGLITRLQPPSGPGIREDSGIYSGYEVPIYYDPLLSKLSVWAGTRAEAIDRLRRALDEYIVEGVKTTIPFFRQVLAMPDFINANLDTGFIARNWPPATSSPDDPVANTELADLAAIIAVIQQQHQQTPALSSGNAPSEHSATTDAAWKLSVRYRGWR
jgi:acetyl-CoA carboxylase biotin carboxylase subunit